MALFANLSPHQKTRASLHRDVRSICTESCHFLGLKMTNPAMEIVAELIYNKILVYGSDLEAFSKHAKRSTINADDVKLLARRNPSLKEHISSVYSRNLTISKDKRRKTVSKAEAKAAEKTAIRPVQPETTLIKNVKEIETAQKDEEPIEHMALDDVVDLTFD